MTDEAFEKYQSVWTAVHNLVDKMLSGESGAEDIRDKLTNEFRFWKRSGHDISAIPPQPEQEPVAHMYADDYERMLNSETFCTVYSVAVGSPTRGETTIELYTTPPKRELKSTTDMMMELADRLGELPDDVDPRAWEHLLVYAPKQN